MGWGGDKLFRISFHMHLEQITMNAAEGCMCFGQFKENVRKVEASVNAHRFQEVTKIIRIWLLVIISLTVEGEKWLENVSGGFCIAL